MNKESRVKLEANSARNEKPSLTLTLMTLMFLVGSLLATVGRLTGVI